MSTNQMRLDELLGRQVDVQWYEGVAIVQAVCRQLLTRGVSNGEFPAATQIAISGDGSVRVLDTTPTKEVPAAAHLLAGMLSDDVPVRLRLVVSQATGQSSTIENLREFSETLRYFERPDSELIVRNLLDRATRAACRKEADEPRVEQAHTREKPETVARPARDKKGTLRLAAMAAAAAVVVTSGLAWFASGGGRGSAAFSGITNVLAGGPQARLDEPLEKPAAAKPTAMKRAAPSQRTHSATTITSHGQSGDAGNERPGAVVARSPSPVPTATSVRSPMPLRDAPNVTEPAQTYEIIATDGVTASDLIYSTADAAVTPPRQVYPALPAEPPTAYLKRALTVVDLVIAPDGLVERVHLRTPPRDIHEFMLLSAAKAWRFQPALLGGRPVRFLHSVALTSYQ